jgi:hypothetical protein
MGYKGIPTMEFLNFHWQQNVKIRPAAAEAHMPKELRRIYLSYLDLWRTDANFYKLDLVISRSLRRSRFNVTFD